MQVNKMFHFDSAHSLPDYDGQCANVHGHTWHLTVSLDGVVDAVSGMVFDYVELKQIVEPIIAELDHENLNIIVLNPTCENMVEFIGRRLREILEKDSTLFERIWSLTISLQEGDGGWATEDFTLFNPRETTEEPTLNSDVGGTTHA